MATIDESTGGWLECPGGGVTPIRGACFLGRLPNNNVVLPSQRVSRRHAMIHAQGAREFWLIDLGSANGTFVNGRRLTAPRRLRDGDRIRIGEFILTFRQRAHPATDGTHSPTTTDVTVQEITRLPCWLMVADIQGFTKMTQKLPSAEVVKLTGQWLGRCKQCIEGHRGILNNVQGDGFLAYWGESGQTRKEVARAFEDEVVLTLEEMTNMQKKGNPSFRIVLHFGYACESQADPTGGVSLIDRDVNFVFRMETVAKQEPVLRLCSEAVYKRLKGRLPMEYLGAFSLPDFKGRFRFYKFGLGG